MNERQTAKQIHHTHLSQIRNQTLSSENLHRHTSLSLSLSHSSRERNKINTSLSNSISSDLSCRS
ncbi:hypothetical protein Scep_028965 [Stephania cephalantha]|uniref:Uncharacterized protein n=1 Tax=Stephania cephalantha TaxID=152367 RepID=A0AAP0EF48_9MAGN